MAVSIDDRSVSAQQGINGPWWLFLVTGIAWGLVGFVVLGFDPTSAATIGYLAAFVIIAAGVNEFVEVGFVESWKWLHVVLGVTFVVAGVMALLQPFQTFGILALLIGWFLLFKGLATVVLAVAGRDQLSLWGLLLASGVLEMVIGVWALGYPGRSAWLLVLWVGIGAIIRAVTEIVLAFHLRNDRWAVA